MGKRVNISQPTVIQTELRPLDESFWIDSDGQLEQWYYQNTGVFSPDRQITSLKLTPHLSAIDEDTQTAYTPTFAIDRWEVKEYVDGAWVTTNVTALSPSAAYSIDQDGLSLIVAKNNYDAAHAINITCHAKYNDPRDVGVQRWVSETVMLLTSVDATQVYPEIAIKNPAARMFNPLKDDPIYEFEGTCDWSRLEGQGGAVITEYKADALGTEKILPANEDMVVNAAPLLDVTYGDVEKTGQQFMSRQTAGGAVSEIVDGVAKITNIKGNTVKWNNIFASSYRNMSYGSIQVNCFPSAGTITLSGNYSSSTAPLWICNPTITTHKYYLRGGNNKVPIQYSRPNQYYEDVGGGVIFTGSDGILYIAPLLINGTSYNDTVPVLLIDLTAMGIDNLTTVAEVEQWLSTNIGNLDYIPYTEGKLVNFGGYGVKWNQLVENGDFSDGKSKWLAHGVTMSASSNVLSIVAPSSGQYAYQVVSTTKGHKYYSAYEVKTNNSSQVNFYNAGSNHTSATTTSWEKHNYITTQTTSDNDVSIVASVADTIFVKNIILIDLTLMFGAGNEPDLDWCNKYLSRDYYPYCPSVEKNILDVMTTKESGFNVFNGSHTDGKILNGSTGNEVVDNVGFYSDYLSVLPNTTYYFNPTFAIGAGSSGICYYDENKTFINGSAVSENNVAFTRTTPANAKYMRVSGVLSRLSTGCINVSDPSRNGEYEPYHAQYETLPMGMKSVGFNLWDEQWELGSINSLTGEALTSSTQIRSKNFTKISPSTQYCIKGDNFSGAYFYDSNMAYCGVVNPSSAITGGYIYVSPANAAYVRIVLAQTSYSSGVCINLSDPSRNGTYEPHWESKSDMSWITKIGIENFNIWDEEWENGYYNSTTGNKESSSQFANHIRSKNFIPASASTTYYIKAPNAQWIGCYSSSGAFLGTVTVSSGVFTTLANTSYINFYITNYGTTYAYDICINKSIPHFNGRYYPYGATAPYFPNGLCKVGNVFDEVKVENGKIKGVVKLGLVWGDELTWTYKTTGTGSPCFYTRLTKSQDNMEVNVISSKYQSANLTTSSDDMIIDGRPYDGYKQINIRNSSYTDATTFKNSLIGVPIIYPLATPYEFEIDYPTKGQFEWYGINGSGDEVPIDQLPVYSQATQPSGYGQGTSRININALYGENIPVILRVKRYPWSTNLLPMKVYSNVSWRIPPVDVKVVSDKGSAVRAQNQSSNFTFSTIVNQQGNIISDDVKQANMVFDWYYAHIPNSGTATTVSAGSGLTKAIAASSLKNTKPNDGATPSTSVWCEAFVLGAYHLVDGTYQRTKD